MGIGNKREDEVRPADGNVVPILWARRLKRRSGLGGLEGLPHLGPEPQLTLRVSVYSPPPEQPKGGGLTIFTGRLTTLKRGAGGEIPIRQSSMQIP